MVIKQGILTGEPEPLTVKGTLVRLTAEGIYWIPREEREVMAYLDSRLRQVSALPRGWVQHGTRYAHIK